jgi:5-formyltetrahydrofolate cyclo-ligase
LNHRVQGPSCQRYSGNPFFTMTDTSPSKSALRSALRQQRRSLPPAAQHAAAEAVCRSVLELPAWPRARRIALYAARDGEIDTSVLATIARRENKQLFLPTLRDKALVFAHWDTEDTQTLNRYNIPEPPLEAARCPVSELDIVFLPLVGWDKRGGRLGMGGGYYDRTLADNGQAVLVGLAHELQLLERVPQESWDIVLNYVATEKALYDCQSG